MQLESVEVNNATLGDFLRQARINKGLDLAAIAEETRISPKNLRAMEEDDYSSLPAEAFTRGFYTLYAKILGLDQDEVLGLYAKEIRSQPKMPQNSVPPHKLAQDVGSMAERPTSVPFTFLGLILLILIIFGAFLCWYFSWNPATYLSEKLRSLQDTPHTEQVLENLDETPKDTVLFEAVSVNGPQIKAANDFMSLSSPNSATAAVPEQATDHEPLAADSVGPIRYYINAEFSEKTAVTVIIDDKLKEQLSYSDGQSASWQASKRIVLTLPATSKTKLTLNDVPLDLPQSDEESVTISIPDYILQ